MIACRGYRSMKHARLLSQEGAMIQTIASRISEALIDEIVTGRLPPGRKLDEKALAERFSVSRTPVRDALRQLATTGLVAIEPQRGATVTEISIEELTDMYDAMGELEALCAKRCAQHMTTLERRKLVVLHEKAKAAAAAQDDSAYAALNEHFHAAIYEGTHSRSLQTIVKDFRRRLAPYRAGLFFRVAGRLTGSIGEHEHILQAVCAVNPEAAAAAMRTHVDNSSYNALEFLGQMRSDAQTTDGAPDRFGANGTVA
jgi:DNA-binding GntR family transcriptional regulator